MYPGIDIIEIQRFADSCQRQPRILERLFTEKELDALKERNISSFAARFAGKEAVLKALGTGIRGISWHDIEIFNGMTGEPEVVLSEKAQKVAISRGCTVARVSLTHDQTKAAAMAIIF